MTTSDLTTSDNTTTTSTPTPPTPSTSTPNPPTPPTSTPNPPTPPTSTPNPPTPPTSTPTPPTPPTSTPNPPTPPTSTPNPPTPPTSAPNPPTPPTSVSVSGTVPASTVTSTESKSSTVAKTSPIGNTTTKTSPESGNSSSTAPSPTTQMNNNGSTVTPITQNNSSEAVTPVTSGSVTSSKISTTKPGPTVPRNPCQGDPCKGGSSCVILNDTHFCLCLLGYYYNSSTCKKGKLFPGSITVKVSETSDWGDKNSMAYQKLHIQITDFFKNTFGNSDYGQTVINNVSTSSARSEVRAGDNVVVVEVLNIFTETTKETEKTVAESIKKAIQNNLAGITRYNFQTLCDYYGCEEENKQDDCSNGLLCKCKQGMERPNPQVPMCVASAIKCPDTCNADNNMQCLVNEKSGSPECVCLSGYKEYVPGICQECAFGYSGVNCEDKFQLILTVVGTIGGALILCLLIALIFLASQKNKNKNTEEQNLIENDFQNLRLQQTTGFSNLGADGSIFPKVRANVSSQPPNPYAHGRSMPRPDY
ncbi:mucin-13 isoform X2 [Callorhinus ursinus]